MFDSNFCFIRKPFRNTDNVVRNLRAGLARTVRQSGLLQDGSSGEAYLNVLSGDAP